MAIYLLYMMMPMIVWLFFSLVLRRSVNSSDKTKRKYLITCGIFMLLMLSLRYHSVGSGDGGWYYTNWQYLSGLSIKGFLRILSNFDMETGYLTCIWIVSHIFKNPQFLFLFDGLLITITICLFLYRYSEDVVLGFTMFNCLGLWAFMVQGMRQATGMCICLYAIEFCKKKKFVPFLLLVVLASTFHASAIVFVIVYLFSFLRMNIKGYLTAIVASLLGIFSINFLFDLLNAFINDSYMVGDIEDSSGGYITLLIYILIIVATLIFGRTTENSRTFELFFYILLASILQNTHNIFIQYNVLVFKIHTI